MGKTPRCWPLPPRGTQLCPHAPVVAGVPGVAGGAYHGALWVGRQDWGWEEVGGCG